MSLTSHTMLQSQFEQLLDLHWLHKCKLIIHQTRIESHDRKLTLPQPPTTKRHHHQKIFRPRLHPIRRLRQFPLLLRTLWTLHPLPRFHRHSRLRFLNDLRARDQQHPNRHFLSLIQRHLSTLLFCKRYCGGKPTGCVSAFREERNDDEVG